jgi:predicted RNA methylase
LLAVGEEGVELEVLEGLGPFLLAELDQQAAIAPEPSAAPWRVLGADGTSVRLAASRSQWPVLLGSRVAVAAHAVLTFDVSRPRGLLSPEHTRRICECVADVKRSNPKRSFTGFRVSAAGQDSEDFVRLIDAIAAGTGLVHAPDDGELSLRFRRSRFAARGWEVLVRLTPRPLSTRGWRTFNYPGAVNATIAAAMVALTDPAPTDRFLNLMSGSGTLLIERLALGAPARLMGVELDREVIAGAQANLRAARLKGRVELVEGDATALVDVDDASFDVLCADLPWGTLVGSHEDNATLYPRVLAEAARVAAPEAPFVVLTHEVRLFERVLASDAAAPWTLERVVRVFQKGHHPRIYLLRRR